MMKSNGKNIVRKNILREQSLQTLFSIFFDFCVSKLKISIDEKILFSVKDSTLRAKKFFEGARMKKTIQQSLTSLNDKAIKTFDRLRLRKSSLRLFRNQAFRSHLLSQLTSNLKLWGAVFRFGFGKLTFNRKTFLNAKRRGDTCMA